MLACMASAGIAAVGHTPSAAGDLTRLQGDASSPSWSPNGKQIAFAYVGITAQPGPYRIVRTSSRPGGRVHTVLAAPYAKYGIGQLQWATDGRILFLASGVLKSVDLHSGKPKRLYSCSPSDDCFPAALFVSPNRGYAAVQLESGTPDLFGGGGGFALAKLRSGRDPVIVGTQFSGWVLTFSPDSRQLVFGSGSGPVAARIPGGTPVALAQSGIPGAALVPGDVSQLQWSPDGRWVAFVEGQSLEVVPTAGAGAPRVLASCVAPFDSFPGFSWSPTSKSVVVVCISSYDGSGQLSTVRPDGTHLTNLLGTRGLTYAGWYAGERLPEWSPDGSRLLFVASYGTGYPARVWTIRPNGHDLTRHS